MEESALDIRDSTLEQLIKDSKIDLTQEQMRVAENDYKVIQEATDDGPEVKIDSNGLNLPMVDDNSMLTGHTLNQQASAMDQASNSGASSGQSNKSNPKDSVPPQLDEVETSPIVPLGQGDDDSEPKLSQLDDEDEEEKVEHKEADFEDVAL